MTPALAPPAEDAEPLPDVEISLTSSRTERDVVADVEAHLTHNEARPLFAKDGMLVSVAETDGYAKIRPASTSYIRAAISERMRLFSWTSKGEESTKLTPPWLAEQIASLGSWPTIPTLRGVTSYPTLVRNRGSSAVHMVDRRGYSRDTGIFLSQEYRLTRIEVDVSPASALAFLEDVVCDFPFEGPSHKAAWVSALLTPLAAYLYDGPAPIFLFDANIRGAGKSLLAEVISAAVLGKVAGVTSWSSEEEEQRKTLMAVAVSGRPIVVFDNLKGTFGGKALEPALTARSVSGRMLGTMNDVEVPFTSTILATGNNVDLTEDMVRRTVYCKILSATDSPESRTNFKHGDLIEYVRVNRRKILCAAIALLRNSLKTKAALKPYGSYDAWSSVVRNAVVVAGGADPLDARASLNDHEKDEWQSFLAEAFQWQEKKRTESGPWSVRQLVEAAGNSTQLEDAIQIVCPTRGGVLPTVRQLGNRLRSKNGTPAGEFTLRSHGHGREGQSWAIESTAKDRPPTPSVTPPTDTPEPEAHPEVCRKCFRTLTEGWCTSCGLDG